MPAVSESVMFLQAEEVEEPICPEIELLWAVYDRVLRDLELDVSENMAIVRDAVAWVRDINTADREGFTFGYIIEHCRPSAKFVRLTNCKAALAERKLWLEHAEE